MKNEKVLIILFFLIFLIHNASSASIGQGTILNTTQSNSSVTFSFGINLTELTINTTGVFLTNVNFTLAGISYQCNVSQISLNDNMDSSEFCQVTTAPSGSGGAGGTGTDPRVANADEFLCNQTYYYILNYGQNNYAEVYNLMDVMEIDYNKTYSWTTVREYLDNWQYLCSDKLNRTLKEDYVCDEVEKLVLTENVTPENVLNLKKLLEPNITLSYSLTEYYVESFGEERCQSLVVAKKFNYSLLWLLLIILSLTFMVIYNNQRKKKVVIAKNSSDKDSNSEPT